MFVNKLNIKSFDSPRRCRLAELTHGLQPILSVLNQRAESPTYFSPTATPWANVEYKTISICQ